MCIVKIFLIYYNLKGVASMDYTNFRMSEKQVQEFAKAIFADIESYVETHRQEYEKFLQSERNLDMKEEQQSQ